MSRGPQDPTGVDWVKQRHGYLSAWHQFYINRHHWVVYNRYKHKTTHIQLRSDNKYCWGDEIDFLWGLWHTERPRGCRQTGNHIRIAEETLNIQGNTPREYKYEFYLGILILSWNAGYAVCSFINIFIKVIKSHVGWKLLSLITSGVLGSSFNCRWHYWNFGPSHNVNYFGGSYQGKLFAVVRTEGLVKAIRLSWNPPQHGP